MIPTAAAKTARATATQTAVIGAGTVIVSLIEIGVEAATGTIVEEMGAVLDRPRVLTQTKVTARAAAALAIDSEVAAEEGEAETAETTTAEAAALAHALPVVIAMTPSTVTAPATGPETAAVALVRSGATVARRRQSLPRPPKMTVISAPSSCSRSPSALKLAICAPSSSLSDLSSKRRLSRTVSLAAPRGKYRTSPACPQWINRHRSVGYVEFKDEASVPKALELTGQKLKGVPIIAQLTEAEKNRAARPSEGGAAPGANGAPFHRLYVGNIHFSVTEPDLQQIFEPYGELEQVILQRDETNPGRSKGYGFVQ
jgi:hypothetical protein